MGACGMDAGDHIQYVWPGVVKNNKGTIHPSGPSLERLDFYADLNTVIAVQVHKFADQIP
jgi:hypothetical protein